MKYHRRDLRVTSFWHFWDATEEDARMKKHNLNATKANGKR
jgi:hypothetical protein